MYLLSTCLHQNTKLDTLQGKIYDEIIYFDYKK